MARVPSLRFHRSLDERLADQSCERIGQNAPLMEHLRSRCILCNRFLPRIHEALSHGRTNRVDMVEHAHQESQQLCVLPHEPPCYLCQRAYHKPALWRGTLSCTASPLIKGERVQEVTRQGFHCPQCQLPFESDEAVNVHLWHRRGLRADRDLVSLPRLVTALLPRTCYGCWKAVTFRPCLLSDLCVDAPRREFLAL